MAWPPPGWEEAVFQKRRVIFFIQEFGDAIPGNVVFVGWAAGACEDDSGASGKARPEKASGRLGARVVGGGRQGGDRGPPAGVQGMGRCQRQVRLPGR